MKRNIERKLLFAGSIWNLITSLITLFSYNTTFKEDGARLLDTTNNNTETLIYEAYLIDNISGVILTFGLFIFVGSIVNYFISIKLKDNKIQCYVMSWILIWGLVQLISMDIIGFIIFMVSFIIYTAKNKAIKLTLSENNYS